MASPLPSPRYKFRLRAATQKHLLEKPNTLPDWDMNQGSRLSSAEPLAFIKTRQSNSKYVPD